MLKNFKRSAGFFTSLVLLFPLQAIKLNIEQQNYKININYTESAFPGDAVFIRLQIDKAKLISALAILSGPGNEKPLLQALFYPVETPQTSEKNALIVIIPLSSWYPVAEYSIQIQYQIEGQQKMQFKLPLKLNKKDFISETLYLDAANTAIKTDNSPERKTQIDRLNGILEAINYEAIYQTKKFILPVTQKRRTSFFADRRIYAYSDGKSSASLHYGIDFGIPSGTPVFSCGAGKVVLAENRITTGWSVVIEHLPGLYSLYYHLNSFAVAEGQYVKQGEQIGLSGKSGLATGPHLHWEVRLLGWAVNPDFFTEQFLID